MVTCMNSHVNIQTSPQALPTGTWTIDPARTTITISAKKLGFITVPATLTVSSGSIEIDADHRVASVEVVADAGSYASKNAKRNDHVRSADFLDVDNHPELTFGTDQVEPSGDGHHADGSVTVKGQRFPVSVAISDVEFDESRGSFVASATIDRHAIGIDKMPGLVIGRNLQLTVEATATKNT